MATRILVRCKTEEMPGLLCEKIPLMANAACQKIWKRDFIPDNDRLVTVGGYMNVRCFILIDNGPVDANEYSIVHLCWKDQEFHNVPGPLHPYIKKQLETMYQFNPADRPKTITYTNEELKIKLGPDKYNKLMQDREEQLTRAKAKYGDV